MLSYSLWNMLLLLLLSAPASSTSASSCSAFTVPKTTKCYPFRQRQVNGHVKSSSSASQPSALMPPFSANYTLQFPTHNKLLELSPGQAVPSEIISAAAPCGEMHNFRVLLYPRGGGGEEDLSNRKLNILGNDKLERKSTGFGMAYRVLPMFGKPQQERVGIYLQYLSQHDMAFVDATFEMKLKGTQSEGRRFDLMWSAGMRFVSAGQQNLANGTASDFGAHLLHTEMLEHFMGAEEWSSEPLVIHLTLNLHPRMEAAVVSSNDPFGNGTMMDIRHTDKARTGKIVVPVLQRLEQRNRMFELGAYPGVEYRIMRILNDNEEEFFHSFPNCQYELKPIYPLVEQLERPWPILVHEKEIPKLYTATMYNIISAVGSLLTAAIGLGTAFCLSQAISLFFIPSRSMEPTLQVGDVLLVEKVTPRLHLGNNHIGDVVLFSPPARLREIVSTNGGKITARDLFVKRVAANPGDIIYVEKGGHVVVNGMIQTVNRALCGSEPLKLIEQYIVPSETTIMNDEVFVQGDCSTVSIDSRVWGPLKSNNIVGKPIVRIWPLEHFGRVPNLPLLPSEVDWTN